MVVFTMFLRRGMCTVIIVHSVVCFLCTAHFLHADSATQTDWSSGPGVAGPVFDWSAAFDSSLDIRWLPVPGQLTLASIPLLTPREHLIEGSFDDAQSVYAADVNGDGHMDVLGAAWIDGVAWWHDDHGWIEHTVDDSFQGNFMSAADMDGDDDIDIVVAGYDIQTGKECITWWQNLDDSGTTWLKHTICVDSCEFIAFDIADIDDDGDNDILGAALFG